MRGPVLLTKLAIPYLVETKGNVINISSAVGIIPSESVFAYAMSKAALDHFTRCAAMELAGTYQITHKNPVLSFLAVYCLFIHFQARQVRVNSVNPGFIDSAFHAVTGITGDQYDDVCELVRKKHPIQRIGYPKDIVRAIAFLASDDADFITCEVLRVDGGLSSKGAF